MPMQWMSPGRSGKLAQIEDLHAADGFNLFIADAVHTTRLLPLTRWCFDWILCG